MYLIAIDPGMSGAICFRNLAGKFLELYSLPFIESEPDIQATRMLFLTFLRRASVEEVPFICYLEKAQSMPGNRAQSMLKYGRSVGILEGLMGALEISYEYVHPKTWTKEMHQGIGSYVSPKFKSLTAAKRLFPKVNLLRTEKCKKEDEGFIDALLIAEWGARKQRGALSTKLS